MEQAEKAEEIRVVMVDDEYLERSLLKNCFDWNSINMTVVGEAENAEQAVRVIRREKPDILFTDIQMPGSDGIALGELAMKDDPNLKIVVITGFDQFDYAQRSIKAGISDYLLKPIDCEEVEKTAVQLKRRIEAERAARREEKKLKAQLRQNLPYLRQRFFHELMLGLREGAREKMSFLGIQFENAPFQVAVAEFTDGAVPAREEAQFLLEMKISQGLKEFFQPWEKVYVFSFAADRIVILCNHPGLDLNEKCESALESMKKFCAGPVCIGLGGMVKEVSGISVSYQEAVEAVRYRIVLGNNRVILHDDIQLSEHVKSRKEGECWERLNFYIKAALEQKAKNTIHEICCELGRRNASTVQSLRMTAMNAVFSLFRSMAEGGVGPEEINAFEAQVNGKIFELETLPETERFLTDAAGRCIQVMNRGQKVKINGLVEKMKAYVRGHFDDSALSLSELADQLYFNPSYLSRTFKKGAGVSFTEFLTEVRMEKAVELLREGDRKAFEIAQAVGIPDPAYFSTCFKKYTGVSFSRYRKSMEPDTPGVYGEKRKES